MPEQRRNSARTNTSEQNIKQRDEKKREVKKESRESAHWRQTAERAEGEEQRERQTNE
jgi:hypothetical protein